MVDFTCPTSHFKRLTPYNSRWRDMARKPILTFFFFKLIQKSSIIKPNYQHFSLLWPLEFPQESQATEVREEAYKEDDFPLVEKDCVRDRLSHLDVHKSMGPDGMHPRVLRELADVIAEPLSIIFERSWRTGVVPKDWRKASVTPIFKKGKKDDPVFWFWLLLATKAPRGCPSPRWGAEENGKKQAENWWVGIRVV